MFGTHKKLKAWNREGLLTTEQVAAITLHEQNRHQGRLGRGIIGVALFAIIIGVLSIVAANWAAIPGDVKVILHLFINIALAITIWWADRHGRDIWREGALLVLGGLTLTFIALVGQVYQLGGSMSGALLVWQLAILPAFFIFGQTRLAVLPGLLALVCSVPVIMIDYLEMLPSFWTFFAGTFLAALLPLCLIADGHIHLVKRLRPVWAETSQRLGFLLLTLLTSLSTIAWYGDRNREFFHQIQEVGLTFVQAHLLLSGIFVFAALCIGLHRLIYLKHEENRRFYNLTALYALVSIAVMALPVVFSNTQSDIMAMVLFIAYWGFIAWFAHMTGAMRLMSLAIFLLALRIWIIYLEAFGGLMSTGFGLISGGVFMLVMIFAARRINRRLTGKTLSEQGASHV